MSSSVFQVAVIKGDGIGIDVTDAALHIVEVALEKAGNTALEFLPIQAGAGYFKETGQDIEPGGEEAAGRADAIFLGAIGLPSVRQKDGTEISPHLRLREKFNLYAGVRPARAYPNAPQRLADPRAAEIDMVILRESTEGLFYSAAVHNRCPVDTGDEVQELLRITRTTTEKLHDFAFKLAQKRQERRGKSKVTCVDKANVFRSMAFFRKIFDERSVRFPEIEKGYNYVDAQALDFIRKPWEFDVLVMENMFGDILSDLAGGLVGGMGMAACGEIGDNHGLFQPAHGSAPDIMGQDKANPLAAILSGALMLDYLADKASNDTLALAAKIIDDAIYHGFATKRIRPQEFGGDMGTKAITREVINLIRG
ncbi:isocitrate/isopropylmalate family dehydrogenase [Kiloniella laminariae]|uniref:Isocitrate/isopropylmalate family dehydrogenase n=1 Tax=Kiloniella laminariae TaxID=454162 RepID=A0ABT4LK53_9PROT|nr:isocitrate/isopropylmalate family dehydrogenase [Kiloniella laminariae]MCZ4281484.1 isocitrate/isopropylmalate family dehydrogenase [Kiloniella laminariae]